MRPSLADGGRPLIIRSFSIDRFRMKLWKVMVGVELRIAISSDVSYGDHESRNS